MSMPTLQAQSLGEASETRRAFGGRNNVIRDYQSILVAWALGQLSGWVTTAGVFDLSMRSVRESDVEDHWLTGLSTGRTADILTRHHSAGQCGRSEGPGRYPSERSRVWHRSEPSADMPEPPAPVIRAPVQRAPIHAKADDGRELRLVRRARQIQQEAAFGREAAEIVAKLHRQVVDARNAPETAPKLLETMQAEIETLADHWRRRVAA